MKKCNHTDFFFLLGLNAKLNIGFIIECSSSIEGNGPGTFAKVLKFVKDLARSFDVSKEGTHIGIITYSDEAKVGSLVNVFYQLNFQIYCLELLFEFYLYQVMYPIRLKEVSKSHLKEKSSKAMRAIA